jgi:DNA-binding NarL/FixJ family response regulator
VGRSITSAVSFTERQVQIMREVAAGQGNKDIAKTVGISISAVRHHLEAIYKKTGLSTGIAGDEHRVVLARLAIKLGLVEI